jgi:hypothetical protein
MGFFVVKVIKMLPFSETTRMQLLRSLFSAAWRRKTFNRGGICDGCEKGMSEVVMADKLPDKSVYT